MAAEIFIFQLPSNVIYDDVGTLALSVQSGTEEQEICSPFFILSFLNDESQCLFFGCSVFVIDHRYVLSFSRFRDDLCSSVHVPRSRFRQTECTL